MLPDHREKTDNTVAIFFSFSQPLGIWQSMNDRKYIILGT